ncbi:hypothetical protein N7533_006812 [Penicillium manginii]|jgi:hypothetical protein|uniref:uncharacterized protein n=1 Tax=Penicillium manginii TaxID=203109 RepID=UPI00254939CB|nr:uncharacterized protein N7533_006812 [Penicillium manginii]KAJ5749784.1 hypothetical protein N7533_006812 [Penicillium manginii]
MASRSPAAATPLPKSSVAPESPSKEANTTPTPQTVPFPSPQTFEILPQLHGILLRLLSQKTTGNDAVGGPEIAGTSTEAHPDGQQPPSNIPGEANDPTASQAAAGALDPNAPPPLDVKDLPTETHSVKIRIQKARAVVEGLPDVQRSVEEQQDEISELEDRVARLRSVISDFGTRAGQDPLDHPRVTVA